MPEAVCTGTGSADANFMKIRISLLLLALLLPVASYGQPVDYEQVLVPINPSLIQGADGARWLVELTIANAGFDDISLFCFTGTCTPIEAHDILRVNTAPSDAIRPGLLYVPTSQARRASFALRSRNSTPNSDEQDFVSEIPVVRENDFRSSIVEIPAVPIEMNYRHMLRVYDANANEGASVRVRIFGMTVGQLAATPVASMELTLRTSRGSASPYALPDEPSWAALPDFSDLPGVRNFQEVHIRVEALDANMNIWAFATATSNTTQRFAVYTPN
jgi:hypothetical protein